MPLSSIFRAKSSQQEQSLEIDNPANSNNGSTRSTEARVEMLGLISAFFVKYELAITSQNMATVSAALSGSHPGLAEAFAAREISGEPIDQRWLDTLARLEPDSHSRIAEVENLIDKFEYALMRFAQTARSIQSETSDHRGALGVHIGALAEKAKAPSDAADSLQEILDLSHAMLARIEEVETMMSRSQHETEQLRESLAKARLEADVDHLTRLPNRRAFERRLVSATMEAVAKGEPLSIAFCDVDHFKRINDRHGHDAGDRVLCSLAATLHEQGGGNCFVARHGGEEFVLLLYGLGKEAAQARVDAIRRVQASRRLVNRDSGQGFGQVSFSAGVTEIADYGDMRSALARADAALYRAKEQGRNRVEIG